MSVCVGVSIQRKNSGWVYFQLLLVVYLEEWDLGSKKEKTRNFAMNFCTIRTFYRKPTLPLSSQCY